MPQDVSPQQSSSQRGDPATPPQARRRSALRLITVPLIAIVVALLYYGLHDRFFLPECDSERAKRTLADILKQLRLEPSRYEPIKTVSSSKTQITKAACHIHPRGGSRRISPSCRSWCGRRSSGSRLVNRRARAASCISSAMLARDRRLTAARSN